MLVFGPLGILQFLIVDVSWNMAWIKPQKSSKITCYHEPSLKPLALKSFEFNSRFTKKWIMMLQCNEIAHKPNWQKMRAKQKRERKTERKQREIRLIQRKKVLSQLNWKERSENSADTKQIRNIFLFVLSLRQRYCLSCWLLSYRDIDVGN